jgi:hypothetical protein
VTRDPVHEQTAEEYVFQLAGFTLNCAEMALSPRGNPRYSALRFLSILRQLIEMPEYVECLKEDAFLNTVLDDLDDMPIERDDLEAIRGSIQELLLRFAEEASERMSRSES